MLSHHNFSKLFIIIIRNYSGQDFLGTVNMMRTFVFAQIVIITGIIKTKYNKFL